MGEREVHRIDAVEIALVELMLAPRPLLALGMEVDCQHAHRLVEHADTGQLQAPAMVAHQVAQLLIDQRIEHGTTVALDRLHDLVHLALRADQRPDMLLHEDALILHEAGTGHARHGFAGGIGHEMDMEIAIGHGANLPHRTPRRNAGLTMAERGQSMGLPPDAGFGPDLPSRSRLIVPCGQSGRNDLRVGNHAMESHGITAG